MIWWWTFNEQSAVFMALREARRWTSLGEWEIKTKYITACLVGIFFAFSISLSCVCFVLISLNLFHVLCCLEILLSKSCFSFFTFEIKVRYVGKKIWVDKESWKISKWWFKKELILTVIKNLKYSKIIWPLKLITNKFPGIKPRYNKWNINL